MYIYGGYDNNGFTCSDLHSMQAMQMAWQKEQVEGMVLPGRLHAAGCLIGSKWYISGGLNEHNQATSDMFVIDLDTLVASKCSGTLQPRFGHAMVVNQQQELLLVGGLLNNTQCYAHILKYNNDSEWQFYARPDDFCWNGYARACIAGDTLYMYGGIPNRKLLEMTACKNFLQALNGDMVMHILQFCTRKDLNVLIATSKSFHPFATRMTNLLC